MNYLWRRWQELKDKIKNKYIFLFLDYDGTLASIADTPQDAVIPKETKTLLKELAKISKAKIAIISGRALGDIKDKVGLKDIVYVGNHGLEIEGSEIKCDKTVLGKIKKDLAERLALIKGVILEDKGFSISVHYRLADRKYIHKVKTNVRSAVIPYADRNKIKIKPGKEVIEIRPSLGWDKGKAVLWLLDRQTSAVGNKPIMPIYIGDDITDEDAFKVLKNKGIAIFVGNIRPSYAQYYLNDSDEVKKFLQRLKSHLNFTQDCICPN